MDKQEKRSEVIQVKVPPGIRDYVVAKAKETGKTVSGFIYGLIIKAKGDG